jgi:hypothetical protein
VLRGEKSVETNLIEQLRQVEDSSTKDCQKKLCKLVIESGNDYVIAVKDNQPKLHRHIKRIEDDSKIRMGNAPANLSIVRAIAINLLRRAGYASITTAQRFLSHDLDKLLILVE